MRLSAATAPANRPWSACSPAFASPTAGEIRFPANLRRPFADREAWRRRVACVYQHSTIIPDLTVAENLLINRQPLRRGFISWDALRRRRA